MQKSVIPGLPTLVQSYSGDIPPQDLMVDSAKPMSKYVYIALYKDLTFTGAKSLTKGLVIVCGKEKMAPKATGPITIAAIALSTNKKQTAPLAALFSLTTGSTLQKEADCPVSSYLICSDKTCSTKLTTHPNLALTATDYVIDTIKPLKKTSLFIGA